MRTLLSFLPALSLSALALSACSGGENLPKEIVVGEYGSLTGAEASSRLQLVRCCRC